MLLCCHCMTNQFKGLKVVVSLIIFTVRYHTVVVQAYTRGLCLPVHLSVHHKSSTMEAAKDAHEFERTFWLIIPAKARDYVFTGICLSVCLSVCYHDN